MKKENEILKEIKLIKEKLSKISNKYSYDYIFLLFALSTLNWVLEKNASPLETLDGFRNYEVKVKEKKEIFKEDVMKSALFKKLSKKLNIK